MPGHCGGVGERGDLVDDDTQPGGIRFRGRPGRPQCRIERAGSAVRDRRGEPGDELALALLHALTPGRLIT